MMYKKVIVGFILSACFACQAPKEKERSIAEQSVDKTAKFIPHVEILDIEGAELIDANAEVEVLADGFVWTEGPLYIEDGDFLLFSDIPNNAIYKWKEGEGKTLFLKPAGHTGLIERKGEPGSNGLLLNANGQMVLCQHGDRRIALLETSIGEAKPVYSTIVDSYKGKRLNSPNDATFHSNGDLYFTDPPYGLDEGNDDPAKEIPFSGVYRLKPSGVIDLITDKLAFPNGIALSPNEKTLYVACSDRKNAVWMAYELDSDGLPSSSKLFANANVIEGEDTGLPDGMKVSKAGYIYATGPGGVWIFNPAGKVLAKVLTGQKTANCALSSDEKYLYLTAHTYVMRVKLK